MADSPVERAYNFTHLWSQIEKDAARGLIRYMSRREFMTALGVGAAAVAFGRLPVSAQGGAEGSAPVLSGLPNGVASGDVTQTSAVLWARASTPGTVRFTVSADGQSPREYSTDAADPLVPVKVIADGLTPGTAYTYRVFAPDADAGVAGRFSTLAPLGEKRGLRFGVSGDWRGELRPYLAVSNVPQRDLDFFVALGDTIYADYPTDAVNKMQSESLDDFRRKHEEVYTARFGRNVWPEVRAAVPFYVCIDDHEVTNDFAGRAAPTTMPEFAADPAVRINGTALYANGLQAFYEYHPLDEAVWENTGDPAVDGKPKLYRSRTFGSDAAMMIVDARSFRDEPAGDVSLLSIFVESSRREFQAKFWTPGRTMLGRPQVEQLKADLLRAQADGVTWKFVMLPEPAQMTGWLGGADRWEGFAPERTEVLQFIEDNAIANVVIAAADIHTTLITRLHYQTEANGPLLPSSVVEITTGPIAFWPPTGLALVQAAAQFQLVSGEEQAAYPGGTLAEQDALLEKVYARFVTDLQGYPRLSLDGTNAELVQGSLICGHSFGWAEFDIDADTQVLTVTTYGIRAYPPGALLADTEAVLARTPEILSVVRVTPV